MSISEIYSYDIEGVSVQTGDLICTTDADYSFTSGQFWRLIGKLIPGEIDHVIIYVGPEGRCVEAGLNGVIAFDIVGGKWNTHKMQIQRGMFIDSFYGVAYPLRNRNYSKSEEIEIRKQVAEYCLSKVGKNYNLDFLNPQKEESFYCSQLAYKAYLNNNIDLNTGQFIPDIPDTGGIIFPQEIWSGSFRKKASKLYVV